MRPPHPKKHTLQTLAPAPAATTAAVVLTLNVLCPSPPVPTISTTKSVSRASMSALRARERREAAAAASISGRRSMRWTCKAARKAPIWVGEAAAVGVPTPGVDAEASLEEGEKRWSSASVRSSVEKYSGVATSRAKSGLKVSLVSVDGVEGCCCNVVGTVGIAVIIVFLSVSLVSLSLCLLVGWVVGWSRDGVVVRGET